MPIEFRITSGARAGARERFEKSVVSIGRHPMNDLRFDANKDIDVSGRHAELRSANGRHVLHDLGSTNGTFVNGELVQQQLLEAGTEGNKSFNRDLYRLIKDGKISKADGLRFSPNPQALEMNLKGIFFKT